MRTLIILFIVATVAVLLMNGVFSFDVDFGKLANVTRKDADSEAGDAGIFQNLRAQVFSASRLGELLFFRTKDQVVDLRLKNAQDDVQTLVTLSSRVTTKSAIAPSFRLLLASLNDLADSLREVDKSKVDQVSRDIAAIFTSATTALTRMQSKAIAVDDLRADLLVAQQRVELYTGTLPAVSSPVGTSRPVTEGQKPTDQPQSVPVEVAE